MVKTDVFVLCRSYDTAGNGKGTQTLKNDSDRRIFNRTIPSKCNSKQHYYNMDM